MLTLSHDACVRVKPQDRKKVNTVSVVMSDLVDITEIYASYSFTASATLRLCGNMYLQQLRL